MPSRSEPSWPEDLAARYVAEGHWRGRSLGSLVWDWADAYGSRTALTDGDVRLTYRELAERADVFADHLTGFGLGSGGMLMVQLPLCWELVVAAMGCWRLGVAPLPLPTSLRSLEMEMVARHTEVTTVAVPDTWAGFDHQAMAHRLVTHSAYVRHILVAGDDLGPAGADLRSMLTPNGSSPQRLRRRYDAVAPDADSVAVLLLAGDASSLPKIVVRTHNNIDYSARQVARASGFGPDTVYCVTESVGHHLYWAAAGLIGTLSAGGRAVILRGDDPASALETIGREHVTVASLPVTTLRRWLATADPVRHGVGSLALVQTGGRVTDETVHQVTSVLGSAVQRVHGCAEGLLTCTPRIEDKEDSAGHGERPVGEADEILVVDASGYPVADGGRGELLVRGPGISRGYFRAATHDAQRYTPDGWFRSNTMVRLDPAGDILLEGRLDGVMDRGEERVSAEEILDLAYGLAQVRLAAVVALPGESGESVCLCVVLHPGSRLTLDDVRAAFVAEGAAAHKVPDLLEVLPAMPLVPGGRVDHAALREQVLARHQGTRAGG